MQAGRLRQRVKLRECQLTQDTPSGAMLESWQDAGELWADFRPLSSRDFIAAKATTNEITAYALIRAGKAIKNGMQFIHGGQTYQIEGILPDSNSGKEYQRLLLKALE